MYALTKTVELVARTKETIPPRSTGLAPSFMICAVGSVFAIPLMTLKVPLFMYMPSLLARSSMGAAAVAKREGPTARPIAV